MSFFTEYKKYSDLVESRINELLSDKTISEKILLESMSYSLEAGGKRLRPVLSLSVCNMLKGDEILVMPFALAIELIHTYSLIHDDLPCMDNDDYRRGKLTNHKVFGEAMAVLSGDALLNLAFETMLMETTKEDGLSGLRSRAALIIAKSSGAQGMVGGQVIDMESENLAISYDRLLSMHGKKTGALIKASIMAPAVLLNASEDIKSSLCCYAENIGLAFQIKDDILDFEGDGKIVGKPTGSDAKNHKSTFVTLLGIEKARDLLKASTNRAVESVKALDNNDFLIKMAAFISEREK